MIKKWIKFNESIETFTEEMAQEIIYYFGEDFLYPDDDIQKLFNSLYHTHLEFITMYETEYK